MPCPHLLWPGEFSPVVTFQDHWTNGPGGLQGPSLQHCSQGMGRELCRAAGCGQGARDGSRARSLHRPEVLGNDTSFCLSLWDVHFLFSVSPGSKMKFLHKK